MIALFSISTLSYFSLLGVLTEFGNWIVTARMERMAFDQSLGGEPASLDEPETLYRNRGVRGARWDEATTGTQEK